MSTTVTTAAEDDARTGGNAPEWNLWRRQVQGILRLELRKSLLGKRALPLVLLGLLPLAFLLTFLLIPLSEADRAIAGPETIFAYVFRLYYLKIGLFLGSLVVSLQLFRGDILDRSLHYYLLCPVRREVLVGAKYLVGVLSTALVLAASVVVAFVEIHVVTGSGLSGAAIAQMLQYAGITALGCVGYGAFFMLAGLYFKNPVVPALALFLWELINPFLPSLLKKVSVIHYLVSLLPMPMSSSPLQVLASDTSPLISVPGLLLVTAVAVYLAGLRLRRMEIRYSED